MAERDRDGFPVEAKLGEQLTAVADNFYLETALRRDLAKE